MATPNAPDKAWERRFSQLAAFKEHHGHCCPSRRVASLGDLVRWIDQQRQIYEAGMLDAEHEQRLDDLGFCWDLADEDWETHFAELVALKKAQGHCKPTAGARFLTVWSSKQRASKNSGRLDPERVRRLESLGFSWDPITETWEARFAEWIKYTKIHGDLPPKHSTDLGMWVQTQRQAKARGIINPERERRLIAADFSFNPYDDSWEKHFAELVAYQKKHGHCCPPNKSCALATWVMAQRKKRIKGKLKPELEKRLTDLGFSWSPFAEAWETNFAKLVAFTKKHGHCCPREKEGVLGAWIKDQRRIRVEGRLDPEREERLNALGFVWSPPRQKWETHFQKLSAFKKKHGHANPPPSKLSDWCYVQRHLQSRGRLDPERRRRLDTIGFSWDPVDDFWETRFAELTAFKKKHGHSSPSVKKGVLGYWVSSQRRKKALGLLEPDREQRLNKLGFSWTPFASAWETRFAELMAYKKKHGHANPPQSLGALGGWSNKQRQLRNKGQLEPEREQRLHRLGLSWDPFAAAWEAHFAELVAFKKKHGHASPPGKLGAWAVKQRYARNRGLLPRERERRLTKIGFVWRLYDRVGRGSR